VGCPVAASEEEFEVSTVEEHWRSVWSEHSVDEVSWYQASADLSLELILDCEPDRAAPIVDVGGGASPLVGQLLERGYEDVTVVDISERALERARRRLGARAYGVTWVVGDVTRHRFARSYAVWHDRAVLHFLTDGDDRKRYVRQLERHLRPGGHAVIATFGPDGPTSCSGLPVQRYDAEALEAVFAPVLRPVLTREDVHLTPGGAEQAFLYAVLRSDLPANV
jgi:SAM-dependent methyltransferase